MPMRDKKNAVEISEICISRPIDSNLGSISPIDYKQAVDNTLSNTGVTHKAAGL